MGFSLGDIGGALTGGTMGIGTALGIGSSALSYYGQKKTNEMNRDISREQMAHSAKEAEILRDWQTGERLAKQKFDEVMSNTAVQRRMKDMKEAGINPILAGKYDASSPSSQAMSGSMGQLPGLPTMQNPVASGIDGLVKGASTAVSLMKSEHEIDILKQEVEIKTFETYIQANKELYTRMEAYIKSDEQQWKHEEYQTKYYMWRTWSSALRTLTEDQRKAVFIGIPGAAMAFAGVKGFMSMMPSSIMKTIKRMLKMKPESLPGNNVRYK